MPPGSPAALRPRVTLVAAVARNRVIGKDGRMPWHLPADLAHFKALTTGHPVVMGRRTWEAIGHALPGRTSVVVTRHTGWTAAGAVVAHSLGEAVALAQHLPGADEVFVIGGGQVYADALSTGLADRLVLTEIEAEPEGDTWFPEFDRAKFAEVDRRPGNGFEIVTYDRAPAAVT